MGSRYPVQCRFDLATVWSVSTACCRVIGTMQFNNFASLLVLNNFYTFDKICVAKADLPSGSQTEKLFWWRFAKIFLFNVQHARERNLSRPHRGILRVVYSLQLFSLVFRIILDNYSYRVKRGHNT